MLIGGTLIAGFGGFAWFQWPAAPQFAGLCALIGGLMLLAGIVTKPNELRDVLQRRPALVAWYYADPKASLLDGAPSLASITIYIYLQDGTLHTAGVPMNRMGGLLEALGRAAPGAVAGFTRDIERDFLSYLEERPALARRGTVPTFAEWRRNPLDYGPLAGLRGPRPGGGAPSG
jgi:hypothetical protein